MARRESLTVGLIANEFYEPALGRMGGFGWAVSRVARLFAGAPDLGVKALLIAGDRVRAPASGSRLVYGVPFISATWHGLGHANRLRALRPDVLLTIDYRPSYRRSLNALSTVPTVVWVRDPRTAEDNALVSSVVIPGDSAPPQGLGEVRCESLAAEAERWARNGRPLRLAVTDPFLAPKIEPTYGVHASEVPILPNPIDEGPPHVVKSAQPTVVFLGRVDPIKRPWVFAALAERFPGVGFVMLGQPHFSGPGSWRPTAQAPNMRCLGHADEGLKREVLAAAWVLVNTSVHEGLAVSFLEALACETPLLAMVDAGGLVSRFGVCVGRVPGTGLDGLDSLVAGLDRLLSDAAWRRFLGREGRRWVERHHGRGPFLTAFSALLSEFGLS